MKFNKIITILVVILVILLAMIAGVYIYKSQNNASTGETSTENNIGLADKVTDECVEEWEEMQNDLNSINVNTSDEKLSPNCSFTFKRHYLVCDHTTNEYVNIPEKMVNATYDVLQKNYEDWNIEKFSSNEVILSKDFEGECGEHYILRNVDGNIVVFKIENGIEEEYEKTDIAVDYLTETDKISFENGLKIYGKENLSQILEDFE